MPLATLHLIALSPNVSISKYLRALNSYPIKPLVASKVIRWIIKPEKFSTHLLNQEWSLLLILPVSSPIPDPYLTADWVHRHWSITAGIPKTLINDFEAKNHRLLYPQQGDVPNLTGSLDNPRMASSSQGLELNDDILSWSKNFAAGNSPAGTGAVSMLNLLSFKPGKEAHDSYLEYGKAFGSSIGNRRGGFAKLVGKVVPDQGVADEDRYGWDEIALAHYPSIKHFTDMLASEDYQKVNHEFRLPALRDTCILCTSELDPDLSTDKAKL